MFGIHNRKDYRNEQGKKILLTFLSRSGYSWRTATKRLTGDIVTDIVKNINIGKSPIIKCRVCGFEFTRDNKSRSCEEDRVYVNIDSVYFLWEVSGKEERIEVIRDIKGADEYWKLVL